MEKWIIIAALVYACVATTVMGTGIYVAFHFISKFW